MINYEPFHLLDLKARGLNNNPLVLWQNKATGPVASNGVQTDGAAANMLSGDTFDFCYPVVSGGGFNISFDTTGDVSCVGIAAHNLGTLGATVRLETSSDGGSTWADTGVGAVTLTSDEAILWRLPLQNWNDMRLRVTGIASGQPAIGVLVAGAEIILPQRIFQGYTPPITPTVVDMVPVMSEGGHFLSSVVVSRGSQVQAEITHVPDTFIRSATWLAFQKWANEGGAFFWAWRPNKYGDAFFAKVVAPITPSNTGPKAYMNIPLRMRLYHDYS